MKAVIQRVASSSVHIHDTLHCEIHTGLVVFICIETTDSIAALLKVPHHVEALRLFEDVNGRMSKTVCEVDGSILLIPQFTLCARFTRGRPSFDRAMRPTQARTLFETLSQSWQSTSSIPVLTGVFGAHMNISLINDGPVTVELAW